MPAKPIVNEYGAPYYHSNIDLKNHKGCCTGLTKLEYAAIHIHAARLNKDSLATVEGSVNEANWLFNQLEAEQDD